jgi:hypothetical protein
LVDEVLKGCGGIPRCSEVCCCLHQCLRCDLAVGLKEEGEELSEADVGKTDVAILECL